MSALTSQLLRAAASVQADAEITCAVDALYHGTDGYPPREAEHNAIFWRWDAEATSRELFGIVDCCYHGEVDNRRLVDDLRAAAQVEAIVSGACQ